MILRFRPAIETLPLLSKYITQAGITRLSDLSYLDDSSNLHVFSAIRPNAKSIAISMGKSTKKNEAQCGALMESIEVYFAEEVMPMLSNTSREELLKNNALFVDVNDLGYSATVQSDQKLDWCLGKTLLSDKEIYIPHIALTLDSNLLLSKIMGQNSNGLASGSNYKEALIYSFLEMVERQSTKSAIKVQLEQVDSPLFSSITSSKISLLFYHHENIFNLPVIECTILNNNPLNNQVIFAGFSCHFSKYEATNKAILEGIQSKIGVIAGARDDLDSTCYNFSTPNRLPQEIEKKSFDKLTSFSLSLDQQYNHIINVLKEQNKDLAIYTYINEDITVLKTFLINHEEN